MLQYIVDAFTDQVFGGNQAAVCVLKDWPEPALMQRIARENLFSETAFAVREGGAYRLRWFTPEGEIDFCGHATLGTAYVLFRFYENGRKITFHTQVGDLFVTRKGKLIEMDFPAYSCHPLEVTADMEKAMGVRPLEAYLDRDLLLIYPEEELVRGLCPDQEGLLRLPGTVIIASAPAKGAGYDCVSRCFAPRLGIGEDPVTGSSHCMITPYWCERLQKDSLVCLQASKRSGVLYTRRVGERVKISGEAALYCRGVILEDLESGGGERA